MIRNAWIIALASAGINFLLTLVAIFGTPILGLSAWALIDVAFALGMAYGIYKKSRTCAVLMLTYFILSKIQLVTTASVLLGLPIMIAFIYFYWQGVAGTFAYHKLKKYSVTAPVVA